jgi:hypothetical protein
MLMCILHTSWLLPGLAKQFGGILMELVPEAGD